MNVITSSILALWAVMLAFGISTDSVEAAVKETQNPHRPAYDLPMRVVIVRNNIGACEPLCPQWVSAQGVITPETPELFEKILATASSLQLPVVINSPGGHVQAALIIGEMIRGRHLDVMVGWTDFGGCPPYQKDCRPPKEQKGVYRGIVLSGQGFCISSCTFILASGKRRLRGDDTFVGVHQLSRGARYEKVDYLERYRVVNGKKKALTQVDKRVERDLVVYFKRMGIDKSLLALFNLAPPSSVHKLTDEEMRITRLITDVTPALDLVASSLCSKTPPAANCVLLEASAKP